MSRDFNLNALYKIAEKIQLASTKTAFKKKSYLPNYYPELVTYAKALERVSVRSTI
jgi:hypothetical protein